MSLINMFVKYILGVIEMLFNSSVNFVLAGEAGQGIDTATELLTRMLKHFSYNAFASLEYMSRIRGGCNSSLIRVSDAPKSFFEERIDFLFALDEKAFEHLKDRITKNTVIVTDVNFNITGLDCDTKIVLNFKELAQTLNTIRLDSIVSLGFIFALLGLDIERVKEYFGKKFSDENIRDKNIASIESGYVEGVNAGSNYDIKVNLRPDFLVKNKILINGNDAVSLGCISGGCNFIASYPMTPGTGLYTYLSQRSDTFNIITEQSEDEIAAVNMVLGAWYAGARAMITTAGGGFSLMGEGVSLCGMIESPMVFHVAQRPAPATGLPTRTEQADLDLVLYSGAGEFPRIILAPARLKDAFEFGHKAFDMADKFQVPVFILTDQYFLDTASISNIFKINEFDNKNYFIESEENYKRYFVSKKSSISQRAIPSYGSGLVCVDSDEHDEYGRIIEDASTRKLMVDKRLSKLDEIKKELIAPEFIGSKEYKYLVIGWGSNFYMIKEAIKDFNEVAFLCVKQLYPLHPDVKSLIKDADELIIVENNATAQLAKLIKASVNCEFKHEILKYDGRPFSLEELKTRLKEVIK